MAQCMRDNGVPTFPDPDADGNMHLDRDKVGKVKAKGGQPAISRLLAYTEDGLKLQLFERVRGRVQPTPEAMCCSTICRGSIR